jgi:hypothetical protein
MNKLLLNFVFCFFAFQSIGQLYLEVSVTPASSTVFDFKNGRSFDNNSTQFNAISVAYTFPRKSEKNFITYNLESGFSTFQMLGTYNNIQITSNIIQPYLSVNSYIPFIYEGRKQPIFDMLFGIGYGTSIPTFTSFPVSDNASKFIHHNLNGQLGIVFYTNVGMRFQINYFTHYNLFTQKFESYDNTINPLKFTAQGITFKISTPLKEVYNKLKSRKRNKG